MQSARVRFQAATVRLLSVASRRRLFKACFHFENASSSCEYQVILMENTTNETSGSLAVLALPRRIDAFVAYGIDETRSGSRSRVGLG